MGVKNNTLGCFDGVDILVSKYLPDNQMFVNKKTFQKMAKWFDNNTPMKELSGSEKPSHNTAMFQLLEFIDDSLKRGPMVTINRDGPMHKVLRSALAQLKQ